MLTAPPLVCWVQFAKMKQDFITHFGTLETKWEELWDEGSEKSCWSAADSLQCLGHPILHLAVHCECFRYHWEKGTTEWQQPAICHHCDEVRISLCVSEIVAGLDHALSHPQIIDPMDVRCFNCNTDRHPGNVKLYQGISTLLASGEVDDDATYASHAVHDSDDESDGDD